MRFIRLSLLSSLVALKVVEDCLLPQTTSLMGVATARSLVLCFDEWQRAHRRKHKTLLKKAHIRAIKQNKAEGQPPPITPDYDALLSADTNTTMVRVTVEPILLIHGHQRLEYTMEYTMKPNR